MLGLPIWFVLAVMLQSTGGVEVQEFEKLAKQVMLNQFYLAEIMRSSGDSGLNQLRYNDEGTKPYHAPTAIGNSVCSGHDHPNYNDTIGLGETEVFLNGVWFRTRHNDFRIVMPSTTSKGFHVTDRIEMPDVPKSVLNKASVEEQIEEMKAYFKAFKKQDTSIRNYIPYFKPVLCYLEGAWTTNTDKVEESFDSPRHALDADSWREMQLQNIFTAASGRKNNLENFATLPTIITDVKDGGLSVAQWNYRMLCHPLRKYLPTDRLQMVDDLAARLGYKRNLKAHVESRASRFKINPHNDTIVSDGREKHGLLDLLFEEIPGMDNYMADVTDEAYGATAYRMNDDENGNKIPLNTGFYHRWFKVGEAGAGGRTSRHRGFADGGGFMAMNTQEKISPVTTKSCDKNGWNCKTITQRWSYAIPLEVVYMTPLLSWDPYEIIHKPNGHPDARTVEADGRDGTNSPEKAYNGTGKKTFARTPVAFFSNLAGSDPADTANGPLFVLDKNGNVREVAPSGYRIFMDVKDVGKIRTRFPVPPLHAEGNAAWKELEAVKDTVLEPIKNTYIYREPIIFQRGPEPPEPPIGSMVLRMKKTAKNNHDHMIELNAEELAELAAGQIITTETMETEGHTHNLEISYKKGAGAGKAYFADKCDGMAFCFHLKKLDIESTG